MLNDPESFRETAQRVLTDAFLAECLKSWRPEPGFILDIDCDFFLTRSALFPEKSAILLEELAYQSREFYTPAYYEITLKTKVSRDQESAAMLDLIYERRTADLGNLFSVGDVMSGVSQLIYPEEKNTFASFMVSKETAITAKLEEMQAFCN